MASVVKKPGSGFWYACYSILDDQGRIVRRKQVSTGLRDRDDAMKVAISLEQASRRAARGELSQRRVLGLVDEIVRLGGQTRGVRESVRVFLTREFASRKRLCAERSGRRYDGVLRDLERVWGDLMDSSLGSVEQPDVIRWRDRLMDEGFAKNTVNNKLALVSACFESAVEQGVIGGNPFKGVRLRGAKLAAAERKPFSLEQVMALIDVTEGEWRDLITVAAFTGQRQQEVAQLQRPMVFFDDRVIQFRNSKARTSRNKWVFVPMHRLVVEAMERRLAVKGNVLFPELSRVGDRGRNSISTHFRDVILPRIGIVQPYAKKNKQRGRQVAEYSFHSLRHFWLTLLDSMGVTEAQRMAIGGHASKQVTMSYTHPEFSTLRRIVDAIEV